MPLPTANIPWPPDATIGGGYKWEDLFKLYTLHDAWYSGDPIRLSDVYTKAVYTPTPLGAFWARQVREERRVMLHVPIAGDLAATSAELLFSEAPKVKIAEAHAERAPRAAKDTQARLDELIEAAGIMAKLLEGAETCAAIGGVFLVPTWDKDLADHAFLGINQADCALPEFRWGWLVAVTFWRVLENKNGRVWRYLERHERGVILRGLYEGTEDRLGRAQALAARPETANLPPMTKTGIDELLPVYVPNMRPNRRFRGLAFGQSDYSGSEGLMDALDECYTSWVRDIRLGQGRLYVSQRLMKQDPVTGKYQFDLDKEAYVELAGDPLDQGRGLDHNQFEIRAVQHEKTALELLDRIITNAGYSPQSFGLKIEGRAESGTALNIRERKSFITAGKKGRHWRPAVERAMRLLLAIDRAVFNQSVDPELAVTCEIQDSIPQDFEQLARSVELVSRAQAASIQTKVALLHPDWPKEEIEAEVQRIKDEQGMSVQSPDGRAGSFGKPGDDEGGQNDDQGDEGDKGAGGEDE